MAETGVPGFMTVLDVRDLSAADGRSHLELDATELHLNGAGTVHGGVLATLVDEAMGYAVNSRTEEHELPATSQLTLTYLRPGRPGTLVVTAEVRKEGDHLTMVEADVEQEGRTLVHAMATFAVLQR